MKSTGERRAGVQLRVSESFLTTGIPAEVAASVSKFLEFHTRLDGPGGAVYRARLPNDQEQAWLVRESFRKSIDLVQ